MEVGTFSYPTLFPLSAQPLTLHMLQVDWPESLDVSGIPGVSKRNSGKQRRVAHVSAMEKVWDQQPWEYHRTSLGKSSNILESNKVDPLNVTSLNLSFFPDM